MKQLLLLVMFLPLFMQSQIFKSVDKGYTFVWVNDTIVAQHIKRNIAQSTAYEYKLNYPDADVYITYPRTEITIDREGLQEIIVSQMAPDTLDLGLTILEPLPNHPIIESVELVGDGYNLTYRLSESSEIPAGGFDVFIDGVDQNNHDNAIENDFFMEITGIDTAIPHEFMLEARYTQTTPLVFPRSNTVSYPYVPYTIEVIDEVELGDFDQFEVDVTDKYKNVLCEGCTQQDIVNLPNIESYSHFFVWYKSPALEGLVSKMKVENGVLMYDEIKTTSN
jgi:hypothetical protein